MTVKGGDLMGFWIYMLLMSLLMPATLLLFGFYFKSRAPKSINAVFGYRTARSMRSVAAWKFAHRYCGRIWIAFGFALLPISLCAMLAVMGKGKGLIGGVGAACLALPIVFMVIAVVLTERALKRVFDGGTRLSVFEAYKYLGECVDENEQYKAVRFLLRGHAYVVYCSKRTANKATHIHCERDGTVCWDQLHAAGHAVTHERRVLIKPVSDGEETVIVLIKGKPAVIVGLDENGFVSSRGERGSATDVFVMSRAAFVSFVPRWKNKKESERYGNFA